VATALRRGQRERGNGALRTRAAALRWSRWARSNRAVRTCEHQGGPGGGQYWDATLRRVQQGTRRTLLRGRWRWWATRGRATRGGGRTWAAARWSGRPGAMWTCGGPSHGWQHTNGCAPQEQQHRCEGGASGRTWTASGAASGTASLGPQQRCRAGCGEGPRSRRFLRGEYPGEGDFVGDLPSKFWVQRSSGVEAARVFAQRVPQRARSGA
jgi:hypothetical protein